MADRNLRLLVVDDQEVYQDIIKQLFENRPEVIITQAMSGEEAIAKIGAEDFDLVLLDIRMPLDREGLATLAEIKRLRPNLEVIMMTAWGDSAKVVEAMKQGARDFVDKNPEFNSIITFKVREFFRTATTSADRERLILRWYKDVQQHADIQQRGQALEDLLSALFAAIPGFVEIGRNVSTATEEIDLVFRNDSPDPAWQRESEVILVECKNWHSQRVGKNEFVLFKEKIENRAGRCKLGFLVCTERFAGTIEKEMLRSSKSELLIVPIDGNDLRQLVEAKNRSEILRSFVDSALLK
ncbi:MAG: response regulator [Blastocatellia bacterium]